MTTNLRTSITGPIRKLCRGFSCQCDKIRANAIRSAARRREPRGRCLRPKPSSTRSRGMAVLLDNGPPEYHDAADIAQRMKFGIWVEVFRPHLSGVQPSRKRPLALPRRIAPKIKARPRTVGHCLTSAMPMPWAVQLRAIATGVANGSIIFQDKHITRLPGRGIVLHRARSDSCRLSPLVGLIFRSQHANQRSFSKLGDADFPPESGHWRRFGARLKSDGERGPVCG
jgi:hypothetical protein